MWLDSEENKIKEILAKEKFISDFENTYGYENVDHAMSSKIYDLEDLIHIEKVTVYMWERIEMVWKFVEHLNY